MDKMRKNRGITLIALVITIIILLILAGVAISMLSGENGILKRAVETTEKYDLKQAEEELSIVLEGAEIEKNLNTSYNKDGYLDQYIIENIEGASITGNIVTVNGYKFEINRDTLKISTAPDIEISTAEELSEFREEVNKGKTYEGRTITLVSDIDLSSVCGESIGSWIPIGSNSTPFKGTFDGNGHSISNIYINKEGNIAGIFAYNEGTIQNLVAEGEIKGKGSWLGGICARNLGLIENCTNYITVTNTGDNEYLVAGISASLEKQGIIRNCKNYANIATGYRGAGGIIGHSNGDGSLIENCINYGNITANNWATGGIAGYLEGKNEEIRNCTNEENATINGVSSAGGIIGSILSEEAIISNCKNKANVSATQWAAAGIVANPCKKAKIYECINIGEIYAGNGNCGGIVGNLGVEGDDYGYKVIIERCINKGYVYAEGKAGNPSCGGIIGSVQFGNSVDITSCYNTGNIAATDYVTNFDHGVGGIVGSVYSHKAVEQATINSCYNTGNISNKYSASYAGQIIGRDHVKKSEVNNCYYLNTATGKATLGGVQKTKTNFSTLASVLNNGKSDFIDGSDGFPRLKWEKE